MRRGGGSTRLWRARKPVLTYRAREVRQAAE
jgi:hypothetical protein